jgi:hypothetical protein
MIELRSFLPSVLRTLVPLGVGYFLAWPVAGWLNLTDDQVTSLVTIVISALYYLVVRLVELALPQFPAIGVLLGYPSSPNYVPVNAGDRGHGTSDLFLSVVVIVLVLLIFLKVFSII